MVQSVKKNVLFDSGFVAKDYDVFLDEYRCINARGSLVFRFVLYLRPKVNESI